MFTVSLFVVAVPDDLFVQNHMSESSQLNCCIRSRGRRLWHAIDDKTDKLRTGRTHMEPCIIFKGSADCLDLAADDHANQQIDAMDIRAGGHLVQGGGSARVY
jgi:hypothetical protein